MVPLIRNQKVRLIATVVNVRNSPPDRRKHETYLAQLVVAAQGWRRGMGVLRQVCARYVF